MPSAFLLHESEWTVSAGGSKIINARGGIAAGRSCAAPDFA